jgi:hypothetical protein
LHHDVTFLTMLAPARSYYNNAWAVTVQRVQADILRMHEFFTNEQEAHSRTLGICDRLNSELQHAWYEHGLANKERERLDAELTRAVDGYDSLKMHIHKLVIEALKSGLGKLVGGSTNGFPSEANATGDIVLYSPDVITKICGSIDTELRAGLCKCQFPVRLLGQITNLENASSLQYSQMCQQVPGCLQKGKVVTSPSTNRRRCLSILGSNP